MLKRQAGAGEVVRDDQENNLGHVAQLRNKHAQMM